MRARREPADAVNRPGIDDALSTTDRLFGVAAGEGSSGIDTIDRNSFTAYTHGSPSPHSQLGFPPAFDEDGLGGSATTPYASSLQPGIVVNDSWLADDDGIGFGSWIQSNPYDASQASSPILSELGSTQTSAISFNYNDFGDDGSLPGILSYNYNTFGNEELPAGEALGHSDNNNQINHFNWGSGEQSSEATGLDSESIYDASGSRASYTDASTPVTNPDSRIFRCDPCNQSFKSQKDLKRHQETKRHAKNGSNSLEVPVPSCKYTCHCGYHQTRKDDYKRHLNTCRKPPKHSHYTCKCSLQHYDKKEHVHHISGCGRGKPGRPRNGTSQ